VREYHASYEWEFDPEDWNNTAAAIYRFAREGGNRVLDLGSGPGLVSSHLKTTDGKDVTCLDNDESRLRSAKERGIEHTILGNLEVADWTTPLAGETFDVIIIADVLEHLVHPGEVLRLILHRGLLAPGGFLVVSIPNAAHEAIVAELLTGRFRYRETGLLDSTHLRFFTKDTFFELCERHGFLVTKLHRTKRALEETEFSSVRSDLAPEVRARLSQSPESQTYQFVARVDPWTDAPVLAELRQRIDTLTQDLDALNKEAERARADEERAGRELDDALQRFREEIQRVRQDAAGVQRRLETVYASRTWKFRSMLAKAWKAASHPGMLKSRIRRRSGP
jgi:2-polyprenyl-3-methyl-5-hydroxy-6-metoxy-1,4-benzoquinol methylase